MRVKLFSALFGIICLFSAPAYAVDIEEDFNDYLRILMSRQNIPAFAALVFKGDEILLESNFGLAHIDQNQPLTKNHLFLMASVSKLITATALLQLYDQDKFDLDDPINPFLPFEVNNPHHDTPITFRMLLTHTSAIADGSAMESQYFFGKDSEVKLDYFMKNYFTPKGEFYNQQENFHNQQPGSAFEYSNEASALIGVLVEQISQMNFVDYSHQFIFDPMGMKNSHWRLDHIQNPIVTAYEDNMAIKHYTFTDYPNGGLRSTARDMHKFLQMLGNEGQFNGHQILKAYTVSQMLSPQISDIDPTVGLHIFQIGDDLGVWGHEGGERGTTTIIGINPETKMGVILLTNISDANLSSAFEEAYYTGLDVINFREND